MLVFLSPHHVLYLYCVCFQLLLILICLYWVRKLRGLPRWKLELRLQMLHWMSGFRWVVYASPWHWMLIEIVVLLIVQSISGWLWFLTFCLPGGCTLPQWGGDWCLKGGLNYIYMGQIKWKKGSQRLCQFWSLGFFVQNLKILRASTVICGPYLMKWRSLMSPLLGANKKKIHMELKGLLLLLGVLFYWLLTLKLWWLADVLFFLPFPMLRELHILCHQPTNQRRKSR